ASATKIRPFLVHCRGRRAASKAFGATNVAVVARRPTALLTPVIIRARLTYRGSKRQLNGTTRALSLLEQVELAMVADLDHGRVVGVTGVGERERAERGIDLADALQRIAQRARVAGGASILQCAGDQIHARIGLGGELVGVRAEARAVRLNELLITR